MLSEAGRAIGVLGAAADGSEVRISAPLVVVAAGAIPTPPLLRRSGLGRHPRLGRNLSIHPATGITAGFEEEVVPWSGVMQSVGIEELHESRGRPDRGHRQPAGDGRDLGPRLRHPPAAAASTAPPTRAMLGAMIADEPSGRVFGSPRPDRLLPARQGRRTPPRRSRSRRWRG